MRGAFPPCQRRHSNGSSDEQQQHERREEQWREGGRSAVAAPSDPPWYRVFSFASPRSCFVSSCFVACVHDEQWAGERHVAANGAWTPAAIPLLSSLLLSFHPPPVTSLCAIRVDARNTQQQQQQFSPMLEDNLNALILYSHPCSLFLHPPPSPAVPPPPSPSSLLSRLSIVHGVR